MTNEEVVEVLKEITDCYGEEFMPKYIVLNDGTVYFYKKDEDRYAVCEQTPPIQEGIRATEGSK
jgi:hypothetical protein